MRPLGMPRPHNSIKGSEIEISIALPDGYASSINCWSIQASLSRGFPFQFPQCLVTKSVPCDLNQRP